MQITRCFCVVRNCKLSTFAVTNFEILNIIGLGFRQRGVYCFWPVFNAYRSWCDRKFYGHCMWILEFQGRRGTCLAQCLPFLLLSARLFGTKYAITKLYTEKYGPSRSHYPLTCLSVFQGYIEKQFFYSVHVPLCVSTPRLFFTVCMCVHIIAGHFKSSCTY